MTPLLTWWPAMLAGGLALLFGWWWGRRSGREEFEIAVEQQPDQHIEQIGRQHHPLVAVDPGIQFTELDTLEMAVGPHQQGEDIEQRSTPQK
jgi:hypothetical protein